MAYKGPESRGHGEHLHSPEPPADVGGLVASAPLADRIDAIELLNGSIMQDRAYRYLYINRIHAEERNALKWTTGYQAKYQAHPTASELYKLLDAANGNTDLEQSKMSVPTARGTATNAVAASLISKDKVGRETFYFLTPEQHSKRRQLRQLFAIIRNVVQLQIEDPDNPTAGSELLPPEVYYNIISKFPVRKE
ncbi:MAG TPA: hypothetical protein VFB45_04670 [Pseudolabrys sp.]|nr:hypothetical protein [Pseudolabrys sp.]